MLTRAEFGESKTADGVGVVYACGEIDMSVKSVFEEHLAEVSEAHQGDVVVDLGDVTFFDSAGLGVLLQARQQLESDGRKLLIARPSRSVTRVLEVSGVEALFAKRG